VRFQLAEIKGLDINSDTKSTKLKALTYKGFTVLLLNPAHDGTSQ